MNVNINACDDNHIHRFLDGTISASETVLFEQHLEHCKRCDQRLCESTAEPLFWSTARRFLCSATLTPQADDSEMRVQGGRPEIGDIPLLPTDDPMMLGRFGGYEIMGVVGRGGMGVVLKGWDRSLDRYVAVKVLLPTYAHQSSARKRFAREAKAAAAVVHDNVIAIHGVDSCNDLPYLVMPYVNGESLQRRIQREAPLSIESILEISLQVARGLQAAHEQGLVHRDIKPANILLPQSVSRVLITDFGLARAADDATLTSSGIIAGTPAYMSPEQARGEVVDCRTDLYSLGSTMYAMACGHPPFRAETSYGVLRRITDERHRPLTQVQREIPRWFEATVDCLLEKKPSDRFVSASELANHLENCLAHVRQPLVKPLPKLRPSPRSRFRRLLLTAVCLLTGAAAVLTYQMVGEEYAKRATASGTVSALDVESHVQESSQGLNQDLNRLELLLNDLSKEFEE